MLDEVKQRENAVFQCQLKHGRITQCILLTQTIVYKSFSWNYFFLDLWYEFIVFRVYVSYTPVTQDAITIVIAIATNIYVKYTK